MSGIQKTTKAVREAPTASRKLTPGQRVVLQALEHNQRGVGSTPGAIGRIVASLYDQGFVNTNAYHRKSFADLQAFSITKAGQEALNA